MSYATGVNLTLASVVVSFIVGCCFGAHGSQSLIEKEAIKAGVAYYTNNASGESVFKWKEAKP